MQDTFRVIFEPLVGNRLPFGLIRPVQGVIGRQVLCLVECLEVDQQEADATVVLHPAQFVELMDLDVCEWERGLTLRRLRIEADEAVGVQSDIIESAGSLEPVFPYLPFRTE